MAYFKHNYTFRDKFRDWYQHITKDGRYEFYFIPSTITIPYRILSVRIDDFDVCISVENLLTEEIILYEHFVLYKIMRAFKFPQEITFHHAKCFDSQISCFKEVFQKIEAELVSNARFLKKRKKMEYDEIVRLENERELLLYRRDFILENCPEMLI